VASARTTKRAQLSACLAHTRPSRVTETEWRDLLARLAPISESYLRRLLRATGLPLSPLVEGVRQDSFEALERTLLAIDREYAEALAAGDRARARACRRRVIEAKDHARLALRKAPPAKKPGRDEMILWLLTWLENPAVFRLWLPLRKEAVGQARGLSAEQAHGLSRLPPARSSAE